MQSTSDEKDLPSKSGSARSDLIKRTPKAFRLRGIYVPVADIWKCYAAGSIAVSVLSFAPDVRNLLKCMSEWAFRIAPASIKNYMMQRNLQQLITFYSKIECHEREYATQVVDVPRVMRRIYEGTSLKYPRNIRMLAHVLLDQVLWSSCASSTGGMMTMKVYPPSDIVQEFQLSRVDYLLETNEAAHAVDELQAHDLVMSTIHVFCKAYRTPRYMQSFEVLLFLKKIIPHLPPNETMSALAISDQLPSIGRCWLFQHLHDKVCGFKKPKYLYKLVKRTIGQPLFIWSVLEPQSIKLVPDNVIESGDLLALRKLSKKLYAHLEKINYPYIKRGSGRRMVLRHPAFGGSWLSLVSESLLDRDPKGNLRVIVERAVRRDEFVMGMLAALQDPESDSQSTACHLISKIGFLPHWKPEPIIHLRLIEYQAQLQEVTRLAVFEGLSNSLRLESGYSIEHLVEAIDYSIGIERFVRALLTTFSTSSSGGISRAITSCVQSCTTQIINIIIDEASPEFVTRFQAALVGAEKLHRKVARTRTSLSTDVEMDYKSWEMAIKKATSSMD